MQITTFPSHPEEIAYLMTPSRLRRCHRPLCRHYVDEHLVTEPGLRGGCIRCVCREEFARVAA